MLERLIDNWKAKIILLELMNYDFQDYSYFFSWNYYIFCLGVMDPKRISLELQPSVTRNDLSGIVLGEEDTAEGKFTRVKFRDRV